MSSIQLGDLLTHNPLGLRLRTPSTPELMRANVTWSHSSDLRDPGPFMEQGNVLLTTGAQLRDGSLTADDYVDLLCRAGVVALGFGDGVLGPCPPELLTACTRAGLPLFDVPYTTPFIAVSRHIAQLLSQAEHASDARALEAGRALSVAALKSDAVGGVVTELARQLGGWVALLNAEAQISVQAGTPLPLFSTVTAVTAEARRLLSRRQRSSVVLADQSDNSTEETTLQTLGRGDALRGVLVIRRHRTPRGDTATRIVVSQAVALIGVTLEHENRAAVQRAVIRSRAADALLTGASATAHELCTVLGERTPESTPTVVVVAPSPQGDADRDAVTAIQHTLDRLAVSIGGGILSTPVGEELIVIAQRSADAELIRVITAELGAHLSAGMSAQDDRSALPRALARARSAQRVASTGQLHRASAHDGTPTPGVSPHLTSDWASNQLGPLADHGGTTELRRALRTWLSHHGQFDPAARDLGIHRHTLAKRISRVEVLLGRPLSDATTRANLLLALLVQEQTADQGQAHPAPPPRGTGAANEPERPSPTD